MPSKIINHILKFLLKLRRSWWFLTRPSTKWVRVILLNNWKILLVKHTYDWLWNLPGWGVKRRESLKQAIVRELREETNIDLVDSRQVLALFGVYENDREYKKDIIFVFMIELNNVNPDLDFGRSVEIESWQFFDTNKLPDNLSGWTVRRIEELAKWKLSNFTKW